MSLQARYTILRKIADGGTAEIFLATQHGAHGFEKPVVLKRIFQAFYADPQFRNMLVDEAHIAMSLNHSNIVQVLDLGEMDGQYVLALELVDGWTLDSVLRRARAVNTAIPPALALYMTAEVCRALAYAHAKTGVSGKTLGIVHRDISPHNVLLSEQGEVKLTDFGIAKAHNRRESSLGTTIKGKIAYMSPEQASGGLLDSRSDLFSVGTMLYVMICRRYPFDAPTDLEVLLLVKSGDFIPPETARPGLNPEIYRVLKRAMAKAPADRYQRAEEMLVDVEQVMRVAFRAVGQTELKRWLQDLSVRDGVLPLTRAIAAPGASGVPRAIPRDGSGARSGASGGGSTRHPTSPGGPPPPPPRAGRPTPPAPRPALGSSTGSYRPPPPPAALSVGRKLTPPAPPSVPEAYRSTPHVATAALSDVTPAPRTAATLPEPRGHLDPDLTPAPQPHPPLAETPRVLVHETLAPDVLLDNLDSDEATPVDVIAGGVTEPVSEPAPEPASAPEAAEPVDEPAAAPTQPRRSSSWVAEAVLAAAERAGTVPPPPPGANPPPPPPLPSLQREIPESAPAVAAAAESSPPPAPSTKRRAMIAGAAVAVALLVVIGFVVRGGKPAPAHHADQATGARDPGTTAMAQPNHERPGSAAPTPAASTPAADPVDAATARDAALAMPTSGTTGAPGAPTVAIAPNAKPEPPTAGVPAAASGSDPTAAATAAGPGKPAPTVPPAPSPSPSPSPPGASPSPSASPAPTPSPSPPTRASARPTLATGSESETDTDQDSGGDADDGAPKQRPRIMVTINSTPPGAEVATAHHDFGTTPFSVRLKIGGNYSFTFTHDGYRTVTRRFRVTEDPDQEMNVTLHHARGGGTAASAAAGASAASGEASEATPPQPQQKPTKPGPWQRMLPR